MVGTAEIRCRCGTWRTHAVARVGTVKRAGDRIAQSIRVMLTTLLVIVASIATGMLVRHVHPEYRKW